MTDTEHTEVRPSDGATWMDSPGATDKSQRTAQGGSSSRVDVSDHNSKTLATIALIIACILPSLALGALAIYIALSPQIIDAKIAAASAQINASVADRVATAQATAQAGKEHARIALDEVQRSNAQLEARGLLKHQSH